MPSPITFKLLEKYKFNKNDDLCVDVIPKITGIIRSFNEFYKYLYNPDGSPTEAFIRDICNLKCPVEPVVIPPNIKPPVVTKPPGGGNTIIISYPPQTSGPGTRPPQISFPPPPDGGNPPPPVSLPPEGGDVEVELPDDYKPPYIIFDPGIPGQPPINIPFPPEPPQNECILPQAFVKLKTEAWPGRYGPEFSVYYKILDSNDWVVSFELFKKENNNFVTTNYKDSFVLEKDKNNKSIYLYYDGRYEYNKLYRVKYKIWRSGCSQTLEGNTRTFGFAKQFRPTTDFVFRVCWPENCMSTMTFSPSDYVKIRPNDVSADGREKYKTTIEVCYKSEKMTFGQFMNNFIVEEEDGDSVTRFIPHSLYAVVNYYVTCSENEAWLGSAIYPGNAIYQNSALFNSKEVNLSIGRIEIYKDPEIPSMPTCHKYATIGVYLNLANENDVTNLISMNIDEVYWHYEWES